MKIQFRPLDSLPDYAKNARTHSAAQIDQVAASIDEWGWTFPILADKEGIVAGHGRKAAARKLYAAGKTLRMMDGTPIPPGQVPVLDCSGWSPEQRRAYILADNRIPLNAGWDNELLAGELQMLKDVEYDLDLLGFNQDELDLLLGVEKEDEEEDEAPGAPVVPASRLGDVWVLGQHRLMCGDSTKAEDVQRLCDGQLVDMLLTDPPYNVAVIGGDHTLTPQERAKKGGKVIQNDAMSDGQFREFLSNAFAAASASMKPGAVFYIWHADKEGFNFRGACLDVGWKVRQCLIWRKQSLVMGQQDYHSQHEPCLYGWKDGAGHLWAADRKQSTILDFDRPARNDVHPTMKPVALFEYQMLNNTKGGDLVLDLFSGSGTTIIAGQKHGRAARAMELDPIYCDVGVARWEAYTGEKATLLGDGRSFDEIGVDRLGEAFVRPQAAVQS